MAGYSVTVSSSLGALAKTMEKRAASDLARGVLRAAEYASGQIRREVAAWTSNTSTRKTGALARSFVPTLVKSDPRVIRAGSYSALPYARIHELGGVIRPRNARALAIPLTPQARRMSPRQFGNLVYIHRKPRLPILAQVIGKGRIKPQYVLKFQVRISAKHYIARAQKSAAPGIEKIINQTVARVMRGR